MGDEPDGSFTGITSFPVDALPHPRATQVKRKGVDCSDSAVEKDLLQQALLRQYFWLKTELSRSSALVIADRLYQADERHLLCQDLEELRDRGRRRDAVDYLLKKVLRGSSALRRDFLSVLREVEGHLARRLEETPLTGQSHRSVSRWERKRKTWFSRKDVHVLIYFLNNAVSLDIVNDYLLTGGQINLREHIRVAETPMTSEQRANELLRVVSARLPGIFPYFCDSLEVSGLKHVLPYITDSPEHIIGHPKDSRKSGPEGQTFLVEEKCVASLVAHFEDLSAEMGAGMGAEAERVVLGSIVLDLRALGEKAWETLRARCYSGTIRQVLLSILREAELHKHMPLGSHALQFRIFEMDSGPSKAAACDIRIVINILGTARGPPAGKAEEERDAFELDFEPIFSFSEGMGGADSATSRRNKTQIDEHFELLVEEMDTSRCLLDYLVASRVLTDDEAHHVTSLDTRKQRVEALLNAINSQPGVCQLLSWLERHRQPLFQQLQENTVEGMRLFFDGVFNLTLFHETEGVKRDAASLQYCVFLGNGSTPKLCMKLLAQTVMVRCITERRKMRADSGTKLNFMGKSVETLQSADCSSEMGALGPSRPGILGIQRQMAKDMVNVYRALEQNIETFRRDVDPTQFVKTLANARIIDQQTAKYILGFDDVSRRIDALLTLFRFTAVDKRGMVKALMNSGQEYLLPVFSHTDNKAKTSPRKPETHVRSFGKSDLPGTSDDTCVAAWQQTGKVGHGHMPSLTD